MAKRAGARTKPGRESTRQRKSKHSTTRASKAAAKYNREQRLLSDRVDYLKRHATPAQTFRTKRDAETFIRQAANDYGARYDLQSRPHGTRKEWRARFVKVDRQRVAESSEYKRILKDLRSRSKSATGRKAKALEELGRREPWFNFAVGETNE